MRTTAREPFSDIEGFTAPQAAGGGKLRLLLLKIGVKEICAVCGIFEWNGLPLRLHVDHINGDRADNRRGNLRFLCPNCHSQTDTYGGKNKKVHRREPITDDMVLDAYAKLCAKGVVPSLALINNMLGRYSMSPDEKMTFLEICKRHDLTLRSVKSLEERKVVLSAEVDLRIKSLTTSRYGVKWNDEWLRVEVKRRSLKDIAEEMGVSDNAVRKRCLTRGIAIPTSRRTRGRSAIPREQRIEQLKEVHGTQRGYRLELLLGIGTCDSCRAANKDRTK